MALRIRLSRGGSKKRPFYRVVVAEGTAPRDGRFIERLGHYNPMVPKDNPERLKLDLERIKFWIDRGATPSDRITSFLADAGVMAKPSVPAQTKKNLPKAKAQARQKEREEAAAAGAPAADGGAAPEA